MLFNYLDAPAPRGSRLVPEVAAGFPRISRDGKTYTIRLRRNYRFSDGRRVTSASFVAAFNRARNRRMSSPAKPFVADIRRFEARGPYTLRIRMATRGADLIARLAMPFFMATPPSTKIDPDGIQAPVASAGPYFIREWTRRRSIVLERNRFYRGPRPHRVHRIVVDVGAPLETIKLNIDRGATDTGDLPASAHAELGRRHGVRRRSPGRYFVNPAPAILYLAMNHDRPLFGRPRAIGNVRLKKAVNFAIDRRTMLAQLGAYAGTPHDQLLPPTMRGFRDVRLYPPRPDLARARALARGNLRHARGNFYCSPRPPTLQVCEVAHANLREIGLELELKTFPRTPIEPPERRRGEPFDLVHQTWHADYFDPHDFLFLVDGWTIKPAGNTNTAYFNVLAYNRKIRDARLLTGARRFAAFAALDAEIMRDAAPVAVYGVPNDRHYVSARTGCYHYHPVYGLDLPAICVR